MLDTAPLISALQPVADRLRTLPESALRRGAATEGLALARELAARAQRLEFPGQAPRELPGAGVFAVGDQLLVVVHDLAEALHGFDAHVPDVPDASGAAARELAEAVELLRSGAERIADAAAGSTGTR